jgi:hypothetical protein
MCPRTQLSCLILKELTTWQTGVSRRIILKCLKTECECVDFIYPARSSEEQHSLVITVPNLRAPQKVGNCLLSQQLLASEGLCSMELVG